MNAKKLVIGLVTAVTLLLFGGAAYAQQLAAPQEDDTAQASSAHREECDRTARATQVGVAVSSVTQFWRPGGTGRVETHGLDRTSQSARFAIGKLLRRQSRA